MMPAVRFIVSGTVQGVCFRASTREQAQRLGLLGHAKNRTDGCVEVVVSGPAGALDALEDWLRQGPPGARVDAVRRQALDAQELQGFRIL